MELNLSNRGTGIPCRDKRAHARDVSLSTYHLICKNYQFSIERLKAMASNIFKYEESQIYVIDYKYNKFIFCHPNGLQHLLIKCQNCSMSKLKSEDIEFNKRVALRVKELRLNVNKSQSKFAEAHFVDRQIISRWENTKDSRGISIHTINRFCKMINISLKDFFDSELFSDC